VRAWLAEDPDPESRREIQQLLDNRDEDGLAERFCHPLSFGTAGIRGPIGAGPARFNSALVRRITAGLVRYLREGLPASALEAERHLPPAWQGAVPAPCRQDALVVVGHDARHGSSRFAWDAARVVAGQGLRAAHFASALPTPITAFAVRYLGADAGVMVTASHNPATDNGYKVYLSDGAQVVPPHDAAIAAAAEASRAPQDRDISGPFGARLVQVDEQEVLSAYRATMTSLVRADGARGLRSVYSPLHGVGGEVLPRLMEEAGFAPPLVVAQQATPDPTFPTAPFPNPEEPGVMDLALELGESAGADIVLVNDPDADRLAVAVRLETGQLRCLSGDELGALIGDHLVSCGSSPGRLVAASVASSTLLAKIARAAGAAYVETLTGFKWIARAARLRPGHRLVFGYEEALGYAVSEAVADKDGLSAALVVAEMAARAKAQGRSLLGRLDELHAAFGVHLTSQWSFRLPGQASGGTQPGEGPPKGPASFALAPAQVAGVGAMEALAAVMARWRSAPPSRLAGLEVTKVRDILHGEGDLPASDVLVLEVAGGTGGGEAGEAGSGLRAGGRVVLRPSGTEPKLKAYFEATSPPCDERDLPEARRLAQERLEQLKHAVAEQVRAQLR